MASDLNVRSVINERSRTHLHSPKPAFWIIINSRWFSFVDNTYLIVLGNKTDTETTVHHKLQTSIDLWNGILRVSGGASKAEKCYWYFARFV